MIPKCVVVDLVLEKDFVSPPLVLDYVPVERLSNGQRVKVLEPKLSDPYSLAKYDARDFQLLEILESGSYDLLAPTQPLSLNPLTSYDVARRASDDLENYINKYHEPVVESVHEPVVESVKNVE